MLRCEETEKVISSSEAVTGKLGAEIWRYYWLTGWSHASVIVAWIIMSLTLCWVQLFNNVTGLRTIWPPLAPYTSCFWSDTLPAGRAQHMPFRCYLVLILTAEAAAWESLCSALLYHTERGRDEYPLLTNEPALKKCLISDGEVRSPLTYSCSWAALNVCIAGTIAQLAFIPYKGVI